MQWIKLIGMIDAGVIVVMGIIAAGIIIAGKEAKIFWDRVVPACGVLIGTSIAAGIVMLVSEWMGGA
jgi:hypothetical protein